MRGCAALSASAACCNTYRALGMSPKKDLAAYHEAEKGYHALGEEMNRQWRTYQQAAEGRHETEKTSAEKKKIYTYTSGRAWGLN